jgi:glycosyltransferase involved in cell wall biosynthesis
LKRILFISPFPRYRLPSQRFRVELYEGLLEKQNIQFHISSFIDSSGEKILYAKGKSFQKAWAVCKGFLRRIKDLISLPKYDYVFVHREASPVGPPVFEFLCSRVFRKKMIYDFDDSIWVPVVSDTNKIVKLIKCFWKVKYICKWSYKVSVGNEFLASFARQYNSNVILNPTCVDTKFMHNRFKTHSESRISIGWTGSFSGIFFLDQVIKQLKELEKKYQFDFIIIADKDPKLPLAGYKFIKWNVDTEIEDLFRIDIGIMPLPDTNIAKGKCGFKLIQYSSLGIPALASPVGVNTDIIENGVNGYLCTSPDEWYKGLEILLINSELRNKMGKAGRKKVEEHYSLAANTENFLSLFRG